MAKDELLRFRVTAEEKGLIEAAAQRDGVPVSVWMVGQLVEAASGGGAVAAQGPRSAQVGGSSPPRRASATTLDSVPASRSQARRVASQKGLSTPTFKGAASDHGPQCQCLACREAQRGPQHLNTPTLCSKHKHPLPCRRCAL